MRKRFVVLFFIIAAVFISANSVYAQNEEGIGSQRGYLSEEEVVDAINYSYFQLETPPVSAKSGNARASYSKERSNDIRKHEDYAGMYLNDLCQMVICFKKDSNLAKTMKAKNMEAGTRIKKSEGEMLSDEVVVSEVKFSIAELEKVSDWISDRWEEYENIPTISVDEMNNKVKLRILNDERAEGTIQKLISNFGEEIFSFEYVDAKEKVRNISDTINGTSKIYSDVGNGYNVSTPAGRLWSSSKGCYGVITCGHGYSENQTVYSNGNFIGKIMDRRHNSKNDSSFIKLENGCSYEGVRDDQISSEQPVVNTYITLRGCRTGEKQAKVISVRSKCFSDGFATTNLIEVDQEMQEGDSGGGAIGRIVDGGRTNLIVGINKAIKNGYTYLVKGSVILDAYE